MKRKQVPFDVGAYPMPSCEGCIFNAPDGKPCKKASPDCVDIDENTGVLRAYIWVEDKEEM